MSFDLNINNYNKDDLESLLSLETPYTQSDVISKCNVLKDNLQNNNENIELDSKIQDFLNLVNEKLCSFIHDNNQSLSVVTYADNPELMKGTLNPLYKRKINKLLNIDTKFRTHFNEISTDFKFDLPIKFKNIYEISLKSIEFSQSLQNVFKSSKIYTNKNDYFYGLKPTKYDDYKNDMNSLKEKFNKILQETQCTNITDEFICDIKKHNEEHINDTIKNIINNAKFEKIHVKPQDPQDPQDEHSNCNKNNILTYLFNPDPTILESIVDTNLSIEYFEANGPGSKSYRSSTNMNDYSLISFGYDTYLDYDDENREIIDCLFKDEYVSDNTPLQLKLGWLLGYRKKIYKTDETKFPEYTNISTPEALFTGNSNNYLYLSVDDYNNNVSDGYYSAFNSSILNKNILSRISIIPHVNYLATSFTQIPRTYFGPVNLEKMHVQLLDELGKPVYLQNMDYSFALNLTEIYN
jgi:hypothetical protein